MSKLNLALSLEFGNKYPSAVLRAQEEPIGGQTTLGDPTRQTVRFIAKFS